MSPAWTPHPDILEYQRPAFRIRERLALAVGELDRNPA